MKVSQILITYNHENFIEQCLRSVLDSTYYPIEVYIWDNCSTDQTPDIIERIIAGYEGPHQIHFHRSNFNYHPSFVPINTAAETVSGEYIIFISGDDWQTPERVQTSIDALRKFGASAISSSVYLVDENGAMTGTRNRLDEKTEFRQFSTARDFAEIPGSPVCFGAALAWHRSVFDQFGPLREGPRNADVMIPFRGALLGGNYYIEEPLVYRRLHGETISLPEARRNAGSDEERMRIKERQLSNRLANFVRMTEDAENYRSSIIRKKEIDAIIKRMYAQTMRISSRWVEHRSAMAKAGIGIS